MDENLLVTLLVSAMSVVTGGVLTWWFTSRRRIDFAVISAIEALRLSMVPKERLEVIFNGQSLHSLWVVRVVLHNRGNLDVSRNLVREAPSLGFPLQCVILDASQLNADKGAAIAVTQSDHNLAFDIEFLPRGARVAFQILLRSDEKIEALGGSLNLKPGTIENTKISTVNTVSGRLGGTMSRLGRFIRRHPMAIVYIYLLSGLAIIVWATLSLIVPAQGLHLYGLAEIPFRPLRKTAPMLANGLLMTLLSLYMWRLVRYRDLFQSDDV